MTTPGFLLRISLPVAESWIMIRFDAGDQRLSFSREYVLSPQNLFRRTLLPRDGSPTIGIPAAGQVE